MEKGSVIRARCTASSSSAPSVTWFKDGEVLSNDPPHIRIRTSTDGTSVSSVLTVDNFAAEDDGMYHCQASDGMSSMSSTTLSFTSEFPKLDRTAPEHLRHDATLIQLRICVNKGMDGCIGHTSIIARGYIKINSSQVHTYSG